MFMAEELPMVTATLLACSICFYAVIVLERRYYPSQQDLLASGSRKKNESKLLYFTKHSLKYSIMLLAAYFLTVIAYELALWKTGAPRPTYAPTVVIDRNYKEIEPVDEEALKPRWLWGHRVSLTDIINPGNSHNVMYPLFGDQSTIHIIPGHTVWLNEHLAVGHAMYDVYILQLLRDYPIDRIALQRAPCETDDLCLGLGTYESWYRGFYSAMIDAFRPGIPIYRRKYAYERSLIPVNIKNDSLANLSVPLIRLDIYQGFENVYTRSCETCFYKSVHHSTVAMFRQSVVALISNSTIPESSALLIPDRPVYNRSAGLFHPEIGVKMPYAKPTPFVVTVAYRGGQATRQIANIDLLFSTLNQSLPVVEFHIRTFFSSNNTVGYIDQMALSLTTDVLICEHGAFQSNLVYLREGALLIDLRGNYMSLEFKNFEQMSAMFGVEHRVVVTSGLTSHRQFGFYLLQEECDEIARHVRSYALNYAHIMKRLGNKEKTRKKKNAWALG